MNPHDAIRHILDLARWAPSGDNTQPWRFEVVDPLHVVAHCFDTREHCVYDLDGHPSQISMGAMLETASIAASSQGLQMQATRRAESPETRPLFDLRFTPVAQMAPDPLVDSIRSRTVQRRPLSMRALTADERRNLDASVAGSAHRILWLEGGSNRLKAAKLMFHSARIRLTMPEAYEVHRDIIEWNAQFSTERVPDQALGTDPLTTHFMRFVMRSWGRVDFFNRFLAGTWAPRIQLDFLPGVACAAHFVIHADKEPRHMDDYVAGGRAMQRFWLTVTRLGLQLQPEVTPLVFSRYAREGREFSRTPGMMDQAKKIEQRLSGLIDPAIARQAVFMGRVGAGASATARSTRRPLESLILP